MYRPTLDPIPSTPRRGTTHGALRWRASAALAALCAALCLPAAAQQPIGVDHDEPPRPGAWQPRGGAGERAAIEVFSDAQFGGRSLMITDDVADLGRIGLNDQISSLRVLGGRWMVCRDAGFRGCREVSGDLPDLARLGLNDQISSLRRIDRDRDRDHVRDGRGRRDGAGAPAAAGPGWGRGAQIYADANFGGESRYVQGPIGDLREIGFNDRLSSIRIPAGSRWELCADAQFSGRCVVVQGDAAQVRELNDRVSSMRPLR